MFKLLLSAVTALFMFSSSIPGKINKKEMPFLSGPAEIITSHKWMVQEDYAVVHNIYREFKRGVEPNGAPGLENIRYSFNADGTGIYTDGVNVDHNINWKFVSPDFRNMKVDFYLQGRSPTTFLWTQINISDSTFFQTAFAPDQDLMVSSKLVPVTPCNTSMVRSY